MVPTGTGSGSGSTGVVVSGGEVLRGSVIWGMMVGVVMLGI